MFGLVVIEGMTLSGHLSNIIEIEGNLIFKTCKVELGDKEEFGQLKIGWKVPVES